MARIFSSVSPYKNFESILSDLIVIGRFQPCYGEFECLGDIVNEEVLSSKLKPPSKEYYLAQRAVLYLGNDCIPIQEYDKTLQKEVEKLHDTKKYLIELMFESKSWQYAWRSTRCTKDTLHTFVVSVLSPEPLPLPPNQSTHEAMSISINSNRTCSSSDNNSLPSHPLETATHMQSSGQGSRKLLYKVYESCCEGFTVSCVRRSKNVKMTKQEPREAKDAISG